MRLPLTALAIALAAGASANADPAPGAAFLVPNPHGGYNVVQAGGPPASIPFFGTHGFASNVIAHAHDKKNFIIVPNVQDDGHGNKHTVYLKVYFATPEEAAAAKAKM
jgi:hypothetical protein